MSLVDEGAGRVTCHPDVDVVDVVDDDDVDVLVEEVAALLLLAVAELPEGRDTVHPSIMIVR